MIAARPWPLSAMSSVPRVARYSLSPSIRLTNPARECYSRKRQSNLANLLSGFHIYTKTIVSLAPLKACRVNRTARHGSPLDWPRTCFLLTRRDDMLWTIFVLLLVLWMLGLVTSYTLGGFIHILLIVAVAVLCIQLISGRTAV